MQRFLTYKFVHLVFGGITAACLLLVSGAGEQGPAKRLLQLDEGFHLPLVYGGEMSLEELLSAEPRLIIFSALDCRPCEGIYPHLRHVDAALSPLLLFVVPTIRSDGDRIKALVEEWRVPPPVGVISVADARRVFAPGGYPSALRLDRRGVVVGEGKGVEQILQLSRLAAPFSRRGRLVGR